MIRKALAVLAFSAVASVAGAATPASQSAVLNVSQGTVLVNNGSQFVTAKPGQVIKPGDRVMVMSGSSATVKYADGHTSSLPSNTLVSFDSRGFGGYAAGSGSKSSSLGPMYAQAVGGSAAGADAAAGAVGAGATMGWVLAGFGVVGFVALSQHGHGGTLTDHTLSAP